MMFLEEMCTGDFLNLLNLVKWVIRILQIAIPIALILFGTIDMGKAVIAGDEKKMKEAQKPFIKRIVSAVIVFCIPFIVNLVMNLITAGNGEWRECWNAADADNFKAFDVSNDLSD